MNNNYILISNYYNAHRDELLAYVSSRLQGSNFAEDIVHDVFLKLLTTDKMISEVTLPALVYTIANNLIISYYRRHTCHIEAEHFIRYSFTGTASAESLLSMHEIIERLEHSLNRLPENCREIYRLHIYNGMKVSEISQQLDEGYKSVEHRLGFARKAIRRYLQRYA